MSNSLHWIDITIIVTYFCVMMAVGLYHMRAQKNSSEYLLASRSVPWFAIGLSLLSSINSALDFVVGPASYLEWGMLLSVGLISVLAAAPIIFKVFIPFYQRLPVFNCYEYLELRFNRSVRMVASGVFLLWRICWMAFTTYLPAYVLSVVLGLDYVKTIIVLGTITTIYSVAGGARAVVWTDVAQALIMLTGVFASVVILIGMIPGGWSEVWSIAEKANLTAFTAKIPQWESTNGWWDRFGLYIHWPITFFSVLIGTFLGQLKIYGADQVMIQRYLSARSLADCKWGYITNLVAYIFYSFLFIGLSMTLLAFYTLNPIGTAVRPEEYFPNFIGYHMPIAFKGLILAAIISAAQSSSSAGLSACTSVLYTNFYRMWMKQRGKDSQESSEEQQKENVRFSRVCTVVLGITIMALACGIGKMGPLFPLANRMLASFSGILLAIFLLGMFSRRARSLGVAVGAACGIVVMVVWGFGHQLGLFEKALGYGWGSLVGFIATTSVALIVSHFERTPDPEKMLWLWRGVLKHREIGGKPKEVVP